MTLPRPAFIVGCIVLIAAAGCSSSTQKRISQTGSARNAVAVGMRAYSLTTATRSKVCRRAGRLR